jgi:dUTP pyrophosphatase
VGIKDVIHLIFTAVRRAVDRLEKTPGSIARTLQVLVAGTPMYRSGQFVADQLGDVRDSQVQPNGVDLTLGAVFEQTEPGRIEHGDKTVGERRELDADADIYHLDPGGYIVRYGDRIRIPEGHVGFLYPRSSLLRNSCMLDTAVWDAGYEGRGEGLLEVHHPIELEAGARIGQLVLAEANHDGQYDGSYHSENITE